MYSMVSDLKTPVVITLKNTIEIDKETKLPLIDADNLASQTVYGAKLNDVKSYTKSRDAYFNPTGVVDIKLFGPTVAAFKLAPQDTVKIETSASGEAHYYESVAAGIPCITCTVVEKSSS